MRLSLTLLTILSMGMVCLIGCRIAKLGKDYPDGQGATDAEPASGARSPIIQPQRQPEAGTVLNLTMDDSGKLKETLTLRLDYFPAPRPDGVSVPTCYKELAGNLVVGRLFCAANGNLAMDVVANQVNQQCYSANPVRKIEAKSPLVLAGCSGAATLHATRYDPDLKLEVTSDSK